MRAEADTVGQNPTNPVDEPNGDVDDAGSTRIKVTVTAKQLADINRDRLAVSPSGALGPGAYLLDFYLRHRPGGL